MKYIFSIFIIISNFTFAQELDLSKVYSKLKDGDYQSVIESLDTLKSKDQSFLSAKYYLKAISYARLQDYPNSIEFFKLAIKYNNKSQDLYYEFGQVLYGDNELQMSRKAFLRSVKSDYMKAQSNYYIGHISQLLEEHKNAKIFFSRILKDSQANLSIKQIARFQLAESLLHLARETQTTTVFVEKYIIPQLKKAQNMDKSSSVAGDIDRRIKEIENEFGLNPELMRNSRPRPDKKLGINFTHKISYDDNFTLASDLPSSSSTNRDTFIQDSGLLLEYPMDLNRRFIIKPSIELSYLTHSDRNSSLVFSSDSYSIETNLNNSYEHRAFSNPASLLFNIEYDYVAKDRLGIKEKIFNNRVLSYEFGEKVKYFSFGESTFKMKNKIFDSYDETLSNTSQSFSFDQIIFKGRNLYILLLMYNTSVFQNAETNNTDSTTLRFDYIRPEILPKITFNFGISNTWLVYQDETKALTRGTETTLTYNLKLSRNITKKFSSDFEYAYTSNSSELATSNYSKHVTSFGINYNF